MHVYTTKSNESVMTQLNSTANLASCYSGYTFLFFFEDVEISENSLGELNSHYSALCALTWLSSTRCSFSFWSFCTTSSL